LGVAAKHQQENRGISPLPLERSSHSGVAALHHPLMGVTAKYQQENNKYINTLFKKTGGIFPLPLERSSHSGVAALHPPLMGIPATWASLPNISKKLINI
jgi:hypothetical protein